MATVAERQAERERHRREAEERRKQKKQAEQQPDQVTVVGGDPNFQPGNGAFSISGIVENQVLGGAQVISDQVQFKNANDQRQFGGVVNQVVGGQPDQQNNQQAGQQPAGPNGQPNNQQAGAAGAQPGQEKPAAEGNEPPDLLKRGAGLADEDDVEVEVNVDAKGGKSRHRDFVNFLATDKVPDSIFGIPVVQDESQYTEKDLEFLRRNPKAAGFYEMGDEEPPAEEPPAEEPPPRMAEGAGDTDEPPRRYEVQPGDTLTKIARTTGVPAADIAQYSKLADPGKLKVGQTLWLVKPYPGAWNNPGNVKKGEVEYEGESGSVKSTVSDDPMPFLTFSTPEAGLNAKGQAVGQMVREKIPERYREGKLPSTDFTVSNLINVYAPPSDRNDTPEYIGYVSKRLGVGKDDVLDMGDVEKMASLLEAIAERDSGQDKARWFRRSDYVNAARKMPVPAKPRKAPAETKAKATRKSRKGAAD